MAHTYISNLIHYVFSTKDRRKCIGEELRPKLWAYLGGIARENQMKALAVGGTDDHVHVLLSLPPTIAIAKAVQLLKGGSSKWINEHPGPEFHWQDGYGVYGERFQPGQDSRVRSKAARASSKAQLRRGVHGLVEKAPH